MACDVEKSQTNLYPFSIEVDSVKLAEPLFGASVELTSFDAYPIILLFAGAIYLFESSSRGASNNKIPP